MYILYNKTPSGALLEEHEKPHYHAIIFLGLFKENIVEIKHIIRDKNGHLHVYIIIDGKTYYIRIQEFKSLLL